MTWIHLEQTLQKVLQVLIREGLRVRWRVQERKLLQLLLDWRQECHHVEVHDGELITRRLHGQNGGHNLGCLLLLLDLLAVLLLSRAARVRRKRHRAVLRLHMPREVAGRAERLAAATDDAGVDGAAVVHLLVLGQHVLAREDARASGHGALHLVQRVQALVARQIAGRAEALAAGLDGALVRLLARVRFHVLVQRELAVEVAAAQGHGARERPVLLRIAEARLAHDIRTDGGASRHSGGVAWRVVQAFRQVRSKSKSELRPSAGTGSASVSLLVAPAASQTYSMVWVPNKGWEAWFL